VDRLWNVVLANDSAARLVSLLPAHLRAPQVNVFRACLHPDGLAPRTTDFAAWASYLLGEARRIAVRTADPAAVALLRELLSYPDVGALGRTLPSGVTDEGEPSLLVPWQLTAGERRLSLFTTITSFGTPSDITLSELAVELFYPADAETEEALRSS